MMNNNKILTVSYGTFSCTLEGFDDSFGTMKAIAEYFRDLASEDRYFGAEPPQPDAEMLAHIAQKEISRKVVAHQQDGQIVLKAREEAEPASPPVPSAPLSSMMLPVAGGTSIVSTSFAPRRPNELSGYYDAFRMNALHSAAAQTKEAAAQAKAPEAQADAKPVAEVKPADAAPAQAAPAEHPVADQAEISKPAPAAPEQAAPEVDLSDVDIVPGQPDEDIKAFFDEHASPAPANQDALRDPSEAPVNSSIAAKLQRIRSVVSRQEVEVIEADYTEDEHAEEEPARKVENREFVADAVKDIETALDADDATEAAISDDDDDDVSALLSRLDAETTSEDDQQDSLIAEDDTAAEDDVAAENLFETPEAAAPRGRVIKVKRADLDNALAKGDLEEYLDDADETSVESILDEDLESIREDTAQETAQTETAGAETESSLSKEEEDELARELAEVEAGLSGNVATDEAPQDAEPRRKLPSLEDGKGSDMSRLLAETDNQMDDPESAVRRDAISHLRAAVAAKKADIALGTADAPDTDGKAYRSDLAEVVKPRRPASPSLRTERPAEARPAPLKLVAEQRIDTNAAKPAAPVRPRRVAAVAAVESSATSVDGGFAEFASDMGASTLSELLEAAAAYMSFVEGLDQFSRPQLMNTVRQVEQEEFSREEGLRSFGQLLRAGKLKKLDGGRFKASDDIGFQPEERAAG
ncbi:hypothetical protein [Sulfitobacter sp. HGT1]|jgi:pilus assembly protein FimV|uniref:hypothetical protein n=1 Tax=Sulfitobacter sp. HGT1 TaxID=2735435 RepID=UPI00159351E3|nr:hypothetical protein [Sulfitobacter sp. HGT1]